MNVSANLGAYIEKLEQLWRHHSWLCLLDYSSNFLKSDCTFLIDRLLHQVQTEVTLAEHEFIALRNYTSSFPNREQDTTSEHNRLPRAAPLAMMALASVGLFGSGNALGTGERGLRGIFGSCQKHAKQNPANIEKISEFTEFLAGEVFKFQNELNENFFMVWWKLLCLKPFRRKCSKSKMTTLSPSNIIFIHYVTVTSCYSLDNK